MKSPSWWEGNFSPGFWVQMFGASLISGSWGRGHKGAIKVSKYVTRKIALIDTLVLESHRRKIQAKPKDYNKNSSRVS
jgi:hypothetical protein